MFIIEDETHAEPQRGKYNSFNEAYKELEKRAKIPWDKDPNRCPCSNWQECERNYKIIEYDTTTTPWKEFQRWDILNISAKGTNWSVRPSHYSN